MVIQESQVQDFLEGCLLVFILEGWGREGGGVCYLGGGTAGEGARGWLNNNKNPALQKKTWEYLLMFPLSHDAALFSQNYINVFQHDFWFYLLISHSIYPIPLLIHKHFLVQQLYMWDTYRHICFGSEKWFTETVSVTGFLRQKPCFRV